mgnify:FL=1
MEVIGIIAEYNPFHLGHLYHIKKIKEMYKDSLIICVMSSSFCQRGEVSVLNKWDKTSICLNNEIDLVIELPFVFSSQSADIFAKGAMAILNKLNVSKIVFGSETNDIDLLYNIANLQVNNNEFDFLVKKYLDDGNNYPTSLSLALRHFNTKKIDTPNDLLGISYIKEIIKNNYNIEPICIKRTNDYHGKDINSNIISASLIRKLIKENKDISNYINYNDNIIYKNTDYLDLLKYKINTSNDLSIYQTVDEGIESRVLKYINDSNTIFELISNIKTKRYTYNKINRMLIHILTDFKKKDFINEITYIRILGFNFKGKKYLSGIKKDMDIPLISNYKPNIDKNLDIEFKVAKIYSLIVKDNSLIKKELNKPIII